MRNHVFAAAVILASPLGLGAQTSLPPAPPPQIVTSGTGEAQVAPDRATIFVGVETRAATAAAAGTENARKQKAILDTLRALGLGGDQLSTMNYNVSPQMQYNQQTGTSKLVGYTVTNTVRAEVRRIEDVGRLIDAALAKGANDISSLQFTSSKADSVRRAALSLAVDHARADAEALARAAGGSLGALLELSSSFVPVRPVMYDARMEMAKSAAAPTPIEPGQQTISATVTARWAFVPR